MKQKLPAIITVFLIAAGVFYFAFRGRIGDAIKSGGVRPATPEDVIWKMSDASREGNVAAYLDCFTGTLKQNLQKTASDMGDARFSEYLRRLNGEITGIAVSDLEQIGTAEANLRVEFVFRTRNEVQKHHFRLIDGEWKIDQLDGAEQVKTLIPYGSEINPQ